MRYPINNIRKFHSVKYAENMIRVLLNKIILAHLFLFGRFRHQGNDCNKFYVFLNGGIGDCLMALPAIHFLTKSSNLIYLSVPKHSELFFEVYPNIIIKAYSTDRNPIREALSILRFQRSKNAIFLSFNPRFEVFLLFLFSGAKRSYGFIKDRFTLSSIGFGETDKKIQNMNKMQRYIQLVRRFVPDSAIEMDELTSTQLSRFSVSCREDYIVCAPGKTNLWPAGSWEPAKIAKCLDLIATKYQLKVVLIGTDSEANAIQDVIKLCNPSLIFSNLCGKTNLQQLLEVISSAKIVLCNDSGVMHMASVLGIPTVSVFSFSDKNEFAWGKKNYAIQNIKLNCQPCIPTRVGLLGDNLAFTCKYRSACDRSVSSQTVISMMEGILDEQRL